MSENKTTVKQLKEVPGLMSCVLEHEVTKTKATIKWDGPKIHPEIWNQILAFFKWTYDQHKSESQVRLYVNHRTQEWTAWAFPQEAGTGMSARELDTEDARTQRQNFSDADGWLYFGTVHHHCSSGAFQSGVDQANEQNQDGLHITVGKMDEKKHDLHARLYVSGHKFEADMGWFWDVEPVLAGVPESLRGFLSEGIENVLARQQMCVPAPSETEFPEQWRQNVIEIKPVVVPGRTTYGGYSGGLGYQTEWNPTYFRSNKTPDDLPRDLFIARKEILDFSAEPANKMATDPLTVMVQIIECSFFCELIEICYRNDVGLLGLIEYMTEKEKEDIEAEANLNAKGKDAKLPEGNGTDEGDDFSGYGLLQ